MLEGENFYLTREGFEKIKKECEEIKRVKFIRDKKEFARVLYSGDTNLNYGSFYESGLIEARLTKLNYILRNARLIETPPREKRNVVNMGATVFVEMDGQTYKFKIISPLEVNPSAGKISYESPVGKALLGHKIGDEVMVYSQPNTIYKIKKISYFL